jgi:O-antigen/teichoic acid export membrane protein
MRSCQRSCRILAATRDFAWVVAGRLVTALIGVATIRLSTGMLPPDQFGFLAILLSFQAFCGLFLINPVGQYINRNTHAWADEESLLPRLYRYRIWVVVAGLTGALVSGIWAYSQPMLWNERALVMVVVALMVVSSTANATSVYLLNMLGHRALSVGWGCATVLLGLLLSWALTRIFSTGLAWFAGQALGMAIGSIGAVRSVHRLIPMPRDAQWPLLEAGVLRNYVLPLSAATGLMWWLLSGYRLLLEADWGLAALGSAVVGLSLAAQLWGLLESLAMQFLYPLFYRRIAVAATPDSALAFSDLLNTLGPIYLVLASATAIGAPSLLILFVDAAYANVVPFVVLGVVIEFCRALGNVLGTAAQVERRMSTLIPPYALGALVLTVGLLLPRSGGDIAQAVAVLACAGLATMVMMAVVMYRIQRFCVDWPRWGAASVLMIGMVLLIRYKPLVPTGLKEAFESVVVIGILASTAIAALLWNNPGTLRLLAARLKSTMK